VVVIFSRAQSFSIDKLCPPYITFMTSIPLRLITIPVSHYCEKTRWALRKCQIPFQEDRHMPPFHKFLTKRVGAGSVPVLVTDQGIFSDSADILNCVDSIAPTHLKLYPTNLQELQQVSELVQSFDLVLAPAVRQWAYFHIVDDPKLIKPLFCQETPWFEQLLFPIIFKKIPALIKQEYDINTATANTAYQKITDIFEAVNQLLADGRKYLVGDRFSAADLAFATLAAPIISPAGYSIKLPAVSDLPPAMAQGVEVFQATPAGKFVIRLYDEELK
jgi:glutathione S-transferase